MVNMGNEGGGRQTRMSDEAELDGIHQGSNKEQGLKKKKKQEVTACSLEGLLNIASQRSGERLSALKLPMMHLSASTRLSSQEISLSSQQKYITAQARVKWKRENNDSLSARVLNIAYNKGSDTQGHHEGQPKPSTLFAGSLFAGSFGASRLICIEWVLMGIIGCKHKCFVSHVFTFCWKHKTSQQHLGTSRVARANRRARVDVAVNVGWGPCCAKDWNDLCSLMVPGAC